MKSGNGVGVLERVLDAINDHAKHHPDHGVGCACMDEHAGAIRKLLFEKFGEPYDAKTYKQRANFRAILYYLNR